MIRRTAQETRDRLIRAGAEALADEMLRLAAHHEDADAVVRRLTASEAERLKQFKSGLAGLRRSRRFVPWSESRELAVRLKGLLENLRGSGCDPKTGVEQVARFFECDESTLGRCDDSSGIVGDVFRITARDLWVEFASRHEDKAWILDRLEKLLADDDYGVRDSLLEAGAQYLSEAELRALADRFWKMAKDGVPAGQRKHWYLLVCIVAEAMVDPVLHEKATVAWCGGKVGGLYRKIAGLYLEAGQATEALRWLESQEPGNALWQVDHDRLLLRAYEQLGEKRKQAEVARRIFDQHASVETLEQLVGVVGEKRRAALIEETERRITGGKLSLSGAEFLLDVGRAQAAARHIVEHRSELNGDFYPTLLRLAKRLEEEGLYLSTVCLYRALLDSILERGVSKYYNHGLRYLKKLDELGAQVRKWQPLEPHIAYRTRLLEQHGRKRSFWSKAEAAT